MMIELFLLRNGCFGYCLYVFFNYNDSIKTAHGLFKSGNTR